MLIEIAVADAYGSAFEFNRNPDVGNDLSRFGTHGSGELPAGSYTDDTMRTLANARVLLADATSRFEPQAYAAAYLEGYRDDRRAGWSKRFQAMLEDHLDSTPQTFMRALARRATNGCIMGSLPLGWIDDPMDARLAATMQTVSTHSASAVPYVQAVVLATHHLINGGTTHTLVESVLDQVEWADGSQATRFRASLQEPPVPAMPVATIASAALWGLCAFDRSSDLLRWTCSRGGDCDSLAAVSLGLASVATDIEHDLPAHLVEAVDTAENRAMIADLDRRLMDMRSKA